MPHSPTGLLVLIACLLTAYVVLRSLAGGDGQSGSALRRWLVELTLFASTGRSLVNFKRHGTLALEDVVYRIFSGIKDTAEPVGGERILMANFDVTLHSTLADRHSDMLEIIWVQVISRLEKYAEVLGLKVLVDGVLTDDFRVIHLNFGVDDRIGVVVVPAGRPAVGQAGGPLPRTPEPQDPAPAPANISLQGPPLAGAAVGARDGRPVAAAAPVDAPARAPRAERPVSPPRRPLNAVGDGHATVPADMQQVFARQDDRLSVVQGASGYRPVLLRTDDTDVPAFVVDPSGCRLGRHPDVDVYVSLSDVSREHAVLSRDGERWMLTDSSSRCGTTVNGKPISRTELQDGDVIRLGTEATFRFFTVGVISHSTLGER